MTHPSFTCLKSWGESVTAKNKQAVLDHYATDMDENGTLWPTLSNKLRQDRDHIGDYFDQFLTKIDGDVEWSETCAQECDENYVMWSGVYALGVAV